MVLTKAQWEEIEEKLQQDQANQAWSAWIHGCEKLIKRNDWKISCEAAKNLSSPSNIEVINIYIHILIFIKQKIKMGLKGLLQVIISLY